MAAPDDFSPLRLHLRLLLLVVLALVVPTVAGCRPEAPPQGPLDSDALDALEAALEAHLEGDPEDAAARRDLAHLRWLHRGDTAAALADLDALAAAGDPVAQASRMWIAAGRLEQATARAQAKALVRGFVQAKLALADGTAPGDEESGGTTRADRRADRRADKKRDRKKRRAGLPSAGPPGDDVVLALAAAAARYLEDEHGAVPGDDDDFVAFFDSLPWERDLLPVPISRPLLSLRAAIARRHDDPDYRGYYRRQGCVQEFAVGVVDGRLGPLELRDPPEGPLVVDPEAVLTPLACVVRVWNPEPRSGTRRLATTFFVDASSADGGPRLRLELSSQEPLRAYLDGQELHRSDRDDRWPARRVLLDLPVTPGPHHLELHVALPRDKAWVLLRATDGRGRPVEAKAAAVGDLPRARPAQTAQVSKRAKARNSSDLPNNDLKTLRAPLGDRGGGLDPRIYAPWHRLFAIDEALADGDSDRAERLAVDLLGPATSADDHAAGGEPRPRFAEAAQLLARVAKADPSRDRTIAGSRERQALGIALDLDPRSERARLRLLELSLDRGEFAEVLRELQELAAAGELDHLGGDLLRFRAYLARGSESLAEAALAAAAARDPASCEVLQLQRQLAQSRGEVRREDALVAASGHCPGTLAVRAGLAQRRGDHRRALELLEAALGRTPDDPDLLQGIAAVAIATGDYARAHAAYDRLLALNPYAPRARIALADLAAHGGEPQRARARVAEAVDLAPSSTALREIAAHLGIADPLEALRIPGEPAVAAYLAEAPGYDGASEVLVLDRSAAELYADGGVRQIVHTIVELRTKEAIDRYGEFTPPDGAQVLGFHSIKRGGGVVAPERIAGKSGLSLRGLEIGDFVEIELLIDQEPHGYLPGYGDLGTFRFQSYDVPFHVSELLVLHPTALAVRVETRGEVPAPRRQEQGERTLLHWRVDAAPRRGVEPFARDPLDELPSVRVFTDLDLAGWLDALSLRVVGGQRSNPELRRLARELVAGAADERSKLVVLRDWVLENIDEAGDISVGATRTLAARRGNRLMLLRVLLREAGIRSEVWVGRDRFGASERPGGHPMPESYEAPLLIVWVDGEVVPVLTNAKSVPIGYLPSGLAGGDAIRLRLTADEPPAGRTTLPAVAEGLADHRRYDLELTVDGDGDGEVQGKITLRGMEAIIWREGLRSLDRDRLEEAFERAELGVLAEGSSLDLTSLEIDHERDLGEPLVLRFTADLRGLGAAEGGQRALRAALVPMNLGLAFANLPERQTGMVIPYAPVQEAIVTLRLVGDARFTRLPEGAEVTTAVGGYTRVVDGEVGGRELTLRTRSRLRPGVIEAAGYGALVALTRGIQAAEDGVIRVGP